MEIQFQGIQIHIQFNLLLLLLTRRERESEGDGKSVTSGMWLEFILSSPELLSLSLLAQLKPD